MTVKDDLEIVSNHKKGRDGIIAILGTIQSKYGYLPEKILREVADETGHSLIDIYGIATFYKYFSLKPRGKHLVSVCIGTACHVRGGSIIAKELENQLGIMAGETTKDKIFTLETVNCLGACARGPIVVVDGHYFSNVNRAQVNQILKKAREGLDKVEVKTDKRIFPVDVSCARCNHSLMDPNHLVDGCPSISVTISFGRKHGWLRLSCLYGSYNIEVEYKRPEQMVANFFCPHCHAELKTASNCSECEAPMVPMIVKGGGTLQICSRRGCKGHILDMS